MSEFKLRATGAASVIGGREAEPVAFLRWRRLPSVLLLLLFLASACGVAIPAFGAPAGATDILALTPPMGWNDWAHYQCGYTEQTILSNARALVKTGLAARGYDRVTIDDCWMAKKRNAAGNLQANPKRFPHGMKHLAEAVHALGLKFGIYEDAGSETCGGFAGSGQPQGGGKYHFAQDARLFASWGVDYVKLDGCNVYVPPGSSKETAYRKAYAAMHAALQATGHHIILLESAPAYFMETPEWYDVLSWAREYGQLWRNGTDIAIFRRKDPDRSRFRSVLWNYAYTLPLGRFQKPGNWNNPDFIIGGDSGMTLAETRSQMALWSMMSAPLVLSSDVAKLSPKAIAILDNKAVISVDQDPLGRTATLVERTQAMDVLFKPLADGDDAVAVLNHEISPIRIDLHPADFGFAANSACRLDTQNLWNGKRQSAMSALRAEIAPNDTVIWRIHASSPCGKPTRTGTIVMTLPKHPHQINGYARCLSSLGQVKACEGTSAERWTVTSRGALRSSGDRCLALVNDRPVMQACRVAKAQDWHYTLMGNLISDADHQCLTAVAVNGKPQDLQARACGHNQADQIWSLPN